MSLVPLVPASCSWWSAWQGGHCARQQLGELDRLAFRVRHGSMDPISTIPLPKGVHDNNTKKNCWLAVFFFFSCLCHNAKEVRENAGYQNDGFMTTVDAFFSFCESEVFKNRRVSPAQITCINRVHQYPTHMSRPMLSSVQKPSACPLVQSLMH